MQQPQQITDQQIQQIKNLMKQVNYASNSSNVLQDLIQSNPNIQNILALSKKQNVSLKQIAQIMAQQKNVDLNDLVRRLQN